MQNARETGSRDLPSTALYIAKCVIGTAICYSLYLAFPRYPLYWSIISVLLVLDPDEKESIRLSYVRMKANIAGAAVGVAAILAFGSVGILALCASVVATLALCQAIRLGKATRSALAALVIVTVSGTPTWLTGLQRMGCVVIGCLVAIMLTVIGALATKAGAGKRNG
ncbi:MAG: hypothetical protein CVV47_03715 [Spirochaetae bacterium HGW-Spirochaetae-3]|jgi:uncharacterized membrane protein YgaE (UPF0421/DUF939 family)|nr:MAG: hypothetical protein CVV47_03715 [Spirochaetae bacterium HGW-Spirochaetae-3]